MTHRYHLDSDSSSSARVLEPIVLWTSSDGSRRLAFLPHIHDNPNCREACVSGQLRYQRKAAGDVFEDENSLQLSQLHKGEWTKYDLSSEATLALFGTLGDLYRLYAEQGPPRGETTLVAVDGDFSAEVEALGENQVGPLLGALLRHAARADNPLRLVEDLAALGTQSLTNLQSAAGIASLQTALEEWSALGTRDESAWQEFFKRNEWLLAQAFAQPVILFRSGATVRPESLARADRQIVDYVYTNALTNNLALVEIKTPDTQLLAVAPYRDSGIYRPAGDLVGPVSQICAYRHNVKQYASTLLRGGMRAALRADPQCVVVVGSLGQLDSESKMDSFEQYRRELRNVQVLTFDEVRARAEGMLALLSATSGNRDDEAGDVASCEGEEIPF
ncbi:MAG TPA: Shedu immune nuclease family protein [Coriobacteriia bacterium]|jgi:hypothetical protein